MKLRNKEKVIIDKFNEKIKEKNADAYRVFIEFAYAHYDEFSQYITQVVNGDTEPFFEEKEE